MARERSELERIGEPTPPLELDPQTVMPGGVVHLRLLGPPGGIAAAGFTLIGPGPGGPAERERERVL